MQDRLVFLLLFSFLYVSSGGVFAFEIVRNGPDTRLIFEGAELLKDHGNQHFEDGWLMKDPLYRPSCYLHTPTFSLPYQATIDAIIHYEAYWRDVIEEVSDLSENGIARFDIGYDDVAGEPHRKSNYLSVSDLGNIMWLAQGSGFTQVRTETSGLQTIHLKQSLIPAASSHIRVKMCAIGPNARIPVSRIELKISQPSEFLPAATENTNSTFNCFDTGIFLTNCRLGDAVLDDPGGSELQYRVSLNYHCRGHDIEMALKTDSLEKRLSPSAVEQVVELSGRGLSLVDLNPNKTRSSTFDLGCVIKVNSLKKSVSESQKASILKIRETLEKTAEHSKISVQAFVDLHLLGQCIESIREALDFANTLGSLRGKDRFEKISFSKLLSRRQLESLKTLLETRSILVQSDTQYDRFKKLEEEARQGLRELECLISESVVEGRGA